MAALTMLPLPALTRARKLKLLLAPTASEPAWVAVIVPLLWLWQDWSAWAWWQRAWRLAVLVGAGGTAYAALLWLQGIRPRDLRGH
jgi:hypothetical protein